MVKFDRQNVYQACQSLDRYLRINHGVRLDLAYGNACGRENRGEFKSPLYQEIAAQVASSNFDVETYLNYVPTSSREFNGRPLTRVV